MLSTANNQLHALRVRASGSRRSVPMTWPATDRYLPETLAGCIR